MPSISLAIMVRDDAERLKRCIRSASAAVDEVVVLDTGSKDDTVDVAKAEGARVALIEWPNNFATALNSLLAEVETDWILRLDSDEWFDLEIKAPIRECIGRDEVYGFRLIRRDIRPQGGFEEISLIRLWRHHPDLKYKGVVHENIPTPLFHQVWPGKVEKLAPLWFWHDGYGQGQLEKIRRNLPLMELELAQNPDQPYYEAMLAKGYKDIEDPRWVDLMNRIVDRSFGEASPSTPILSVIFTDVLNSIEGTQLADPRTGQIVHKALQWFSATPAVLVAVSNLQLRQGRKKDALETLLLLEPLATTGQYDRTLPVNPDLVGRPFWKHLDRIADQLGRWDICKRCEEHF